MVNIVSSFQGHPNMILFAQARSTVKLHSSESVDDDNTD
jgi:hypothetical protein